MRTDLWAAVYVLAVLLPPRTSVAAEVSAPCSGPIHRGNVAACALRASSALTRAMALERASEGRRVTARSFLPSNPTLGATIGSRAGPADRAVNWSLSLGQELEVAGQNALRVAVVNEELQAQTHRVSATRAAIAANAWLAYFGVLATTERLHLAGKLASATEAVAATVRAMTARGLASEVDADIAEAAALRATQERIALQTTLSASKVQLFRLTGRATEIVQGPLEPLNNTVAPKSPTQRPELLALRDEQQALERKVELIRRERLPNPTVSLFAQNDGFNERVLGVGLSVPIPIPQPLGRTRAGQIAETTALGEAAGADAELLQRELRAELEVATAELDAAAKTLDLYTAERMTRWGARLESIALQLTAARLPVRDALIAQQMLVEQLKAEVAAREALCIASVRLARAAGLSLEGDSL